MRIFITGFLMFVFAVSYGTSYARETTPFLTSVGVYSTGTYANGAAEIVSYDKKTKRLFIINAANAALDVIDIHNPSQPLLVFSIDLTSYGKQANSVAVKKGVVVAAVENVDKQALGKAVFFDAYTGEFINQVTVGALPDMVTFTPDGRYVLVANEGEPNSDYTIDPEGSVSIIDMKRGAKRISQDNVATSGFAQFNDKKLDGSIKISGPGASVAQDLEPEYIAVSEDSKTAWVTLQENNAVAEINIRKGRVEQLVGLGFKDHSLPGNGFDASNKDRLIAIRPRPVKGLFQPDSISSFHRKGKDFYIIANEGDARDYDGVPGHVDEARVKDIILDPVAFPDVALLQGQANLGSLKIVSTKGDWDNDGDFDELFSFGARSFSILNSKGKMIFDSGDQFEQITATVLPDNFNSDDEKNDSFDSRSDDKGPEPEGTAIAEVNGKHYAFIGLERIGGVMVYDVSNPYRPSFVQYINTRDFNGNPKLGQAGNLSPEGLLFISQSDSPIGKPLLVVSYEVSGTTEIFEINAPSRKHND